MPKVLTIGTFDTPHIGHVKFLEKCFRLADESYLSVYVGVNRDEFVEKYKGKPSLYDERERFGFIASLGYCVRYNDSSGRELIESIEPDYLVIGSDWLHKDYLKQIDMTPEDIERLGITLIYVPYTKGISSSDIKRRVRESDSSSNG